MVRSILREKKDPLGMNGKTEVVSSCRRKEFVSTSVIRRTKKKKGDDLGSLDGCSPMAKALPASCRLNSLLFSLGSELFLGGMVEIFFATSGNEVLGN